MQPPEHAGKSSASQTRGLWFEDFEVGAVTESAVRTVTQSDIDSFAELSGDFNPLHTDEAHARRTPFRGRIAHGLLVQSIASGLAYQTGIFDGTISALAEMGIRYRAPVRPGDTIRIRLTVTSKEPDPSPKRGWVRFEAIVSNQSDAVVIEGEWNTILLRRRPGR